ncbi:MAG TPA: glycosyltransferase family 2 protein [Asticcacaulis sp.]|nr:glycosyltransferase family 2 protein [Asticcacaulis sp.]
MRDNMLSGVKLSFCIIAKNEADRILACLEAARGLSDDVVVIDSGSTDGTVECAKAAGARVVHHDWRGYGPQKRFAEDCARHDWILNLDADEYLSEALRDEIARLMAVGPALAGYRLRIMNVYPGKAAPRLWADYNNYVRLYDRRVMRFRDSPVHDTVDAGAHPVGQLRAPVIHHSARSYAHIRAKLDAYASLQARTLKKPDWALWLRVPLEYPLTFLKFFIMRRHFTGGLDGVISAHLAAEARFFRLFKMMRANRSVSDGAE